MLTRNFQKRSRLQLIKHEQKRISGLVKAIPQKIIVVKNLIK